MPNPLLELLGSVGYALDTPGAYMRGALARRPGERASGRDMLEAWGVLDPNREGLDAGDVAGFGVEALLDPLNLTGGISAARLAGKATAVRVANAESRAMRAAGYMPEEVAALTKAVDEAGRPKTFYHGTNAVFDQYDLAKTDPESLFGQGIYVTDDPRIASTYANKGSKGIYDARRKPEVTADDIGEAYWDPDTRVQLNPSVDNFMQQVAQSLPLEFTAAEHLPPLAQRLQSLYDFVPIRKNVRMQNIDVRNPFYTEQPIGELAGPLMASINRRFGTNEWGTTVETVLDPATKGEQAWRQLAGAVDNPNQILRDLGYDAIQYTGGQRAGRGRSLHDVFVLLDPANQVYKPFGVAPTLKPEPRGLNPLLAALAGYNTARGFR